MLDPELLSALLKKIRSRGGDYADIFVETRKVTYISVEDGKVERAISGIDRGVGMRVIAGGKTAFAFSNDFAKESLLNLAASLSRTFPEKGNQHLLDMRGAKSSVDLATGMLDQDVQTERKIALVRSADRAARSFSSQIRQVTVAYRDSFQRVQIATSEGFLAEDGRIHTVSSIQVVAADGGIIQTGYEAEGGQIGFALFDTVSLEELSLKASRRAVTMLRARRAPGGRMPIIISSEAGGTMIHEAIGHGLEADLAQQGLSIYSNKIGLQVASPLVTVIDDPTLPNKRGSYRFDDEGIDSQRTVLVEKGVLRNYLYDRLTAMRDGVRSTGNGRRESYHHRPIPRMTNTYLAPGESSPDEILSSTTEGLFVRKMGGGQVNTVTGDFVFDVQEGYLIEKGRLGEPVRGATLTGNGSEVLKSIDMVGSDLGFSIGTCGKDSQGVPVSDAMPTVRIPEMVVGGEIKV